jgi:hypothetical protein
MRSEYVDRIELFSKKCDQLLGAINRVSVFCVLKIVLVFAYFSFMWLKKLN